MNSKTKQDLLSGICVYAIILAFFIQTISMPDTSALFPRLILGVFAFLNTIMIIQAFRLTGSSNISFNLIKMPLLYFAGIVIYAFLFKLTGYFPATAVMLVVYMLILKVRPLWLILAVCAGYMLFIYVLFIVWLKVSLF